jgi:hypothetical protein
LGQTSILGVFMQIPSNATGSNTTLAQTDAPQTKISQELSTTILTAKSDSAGITTPLQQLLSNTPTLPTLQQTASTLTTAARDAWSSAADILYGLLYGQPTTIVTTAKLDSNVPQQENTTIIGPALNETPAPRTGDTPVEVKIENDNQGGAGGSDSITKPPGSEIDSSNNSSSAIPAHTREFDRTGEIEWRPRLNNGNLQIFFRPEHVKLAEKVEIFSPDGKTLLATGKRAGVSDDGRPIYNFDKPGSSFPDGAIVLMTFKNNGGIRKMTIPESSERYVHGKLPASGAGSGTGGVSGGQPTHSLIPAGAKEFERTGEIEWRPRLSDGNLSILFRRNHKTLASKVQIFSPDGKTLLATGKWQKNLDDGRPVYVFNKPGSAFPDGALVVMTLTSGGVRKLSIPKSSEKFTH